MRLGISVSQTAGTGVTINFGRPVLPPDVTAFRLFAVRSGNGSGENVSAEKPAGTTLKSPSTSSVPTTNAGLASETMALRSNRGKDADTGCGVAPSFQVAKQAVAVISSGAHFGGQARIRVFPAVAKQEASLAD